MWCIIICVRNQECVVIAKTELCFACNDFKCDASVYISNRFVKYNNY